MTAVIPGPGPWRSPLEAGGLGRGSARAKAEMAQDERFDAIVIGGGPTGMTTAADLGRRYDATRGVGRLTPDRLRPSNHQMYGEQLLRCTE